jgi:pimeloyl-ACP methyl ester carboxylesterase
MTFVSTIAGQVYYERRGQGPVVVLLHANLHDHHDYDPIGDRLTAGYTTIAVDWPGHGRSESPMPPARVDVTLLADTLADVVDALALPPAVFIGNSVGGFAAAKLALDRPDRVAGLVLVNSGGFTPRTIASRAFCRLLGTPAVARVVLPRLVPRYMKATNQHDEAVARRAAARARTAEGAAVAASLWRSFAEPAHDLRAEASGITVPTLLAWGARDVVLPLKAGRQTQAALGGVPLHAFRTGHVVFASDPDGFLRVVQPFLESATRSAGAAGGTVPVRPRLAEGTGPARCG